MATTKPASRAGGGQTAMTVVLGLSVLAAAGSGTATLLLTHGTAWFAMAPAAPKPAPYLALAAAAPGRTINQAAPPTQGAALGPPLPMPAQGRQVAARRAPDGQYYFDTSIGGGSGGVRMMFDTGASMVMLRAEDAARAGIAAAGLDYSYAIRTANGTADAAMVTLDSLRVGEVTRWGVAALVSRPGKLPVSLLGQSFMSKLSGYRFERGELVLLGD